jgi:sulfide dehydrogenase cytochrome subunit
MRVPCASLFVGTALLLSLTGVWAESPKVTQTSHTQVLAASCAACHGTNGNSVGGTPVLAGLDKSQFVTQMLAFRSGGRASTVMYRHAKGLTLEEIDQLAQYFSVQKRMQANIPKSPSQAKD